MPECERGHYGRGLCHPHYEQLRTGKVELEQWARPARRVTQHGMTRTRTYWAWREARARCLNPNHAQYADYGGRGIQMCERWSGFGGFLNFLEDMGEAPLGLSIDRIDNDGDYEPGNCRWVSVRIQANNRRSSIPAAVKAEILLLAGDGVRRTQRSIAEIIGCRESSVWWTLKHSRERQCHAF